MNTTTPGNLARFAAPPPSQQPGGLASPGQPGPAGPADRGGRIALALAIAGVAMTFLFLLPAALCLYLAAVVVGVRARLRAGKNHGTAPGAIPGIVCATVGGLFTSGLFAVSLVLADEVRAYRDCMSGANTVTAKQDCRTELERAIERGLGMGDRQ